MVPSWRDQARGNSGSRDDRLTFSCQCHLGEQLQVFFGAWCELVNDDDEMLKFRIVGDEEVYWRKDYISLSSPMAKSCLGKRVDDEIVVHTPLGIKTWYIIKIEYNKDDPAFLMSLPRSRTL
ncbi:GreA/GreB family elongation factor [Aeromonas media]|uniref:GreA/GreB family elongation factor n=1 Tax=Aeromonas media TaxID=651 RepID=A0AAW5RRT7_AERME|nr:GreA/GreB family elongation factor [Aeromonas media]MCV3290989.1 GreA/GreB family elongation factor [Aeromonas media]